MNTATQIILIASVWVMFLIAVAVIYFDTSRYMKFVENGNHRKIKDRKMRK